MSDTATGSDTDAAARDEITQGAIEAASKETNRRRGNGGQDGEWLPPLLARQRKKSKTKSKPHQTELAAPTLPATTTGFATAPYPTQFSYPYPYSYGYSPYYSSPHYTYPCNDGHSFAARQDRTVAPPAAAVDSATKEEKGAEITEEKGAEEESSGEPQDMEEAAATAESLYAEEPQAGKEDEPEETSAQETEDANVPVPAPMPHYDKSAYSLFYPALKPPLAASVHPYVAGLARTNSCLNTHAIPPPEAAAEKKSENDDLPPFLQGLKVMYPKKAEVTIEAIKAAEGKALTYDQSNYHSMHQNGIRNLAEHLDYILYTGSRGNPGNAASILQSLLRRPNLEAVKQHMAARDVQCRESREQARKQQKQLISSKVDSVIVQGVKDFLHSHRTSSVRRKHEHDAVEAVLTAACSAGKVIYGRRDRNRRRKSSGTNSKNTPAGERSEDGEDKEDRRGKTALNPRWGITQDTYNKEEFPAEKIAKRLNRSVEEINMLRREMTGKRFVARKQKTEEDYHLENPAGACVLEFCHSIESSWPASKNELAHSAFRPVKNPITGEREEHRLRVWHEEAAEDRYRDFVRSIAYRRFLARQRDLNKNDPLGINSIGIELFCDSTCPCVLDYHPKGKQRKRKKPDLPVTAENLMEDQDSALHNRW